MDNSAGRSDEALYERVLRGDEPALVELVSRYHSPLYKFLYRYTGDPALADDLTQEAFTRFMAYRGDPPGQFRAWAYAVARNLARDHFKTARVRYERVTDFDDEGEPLTGSLPDGDGGFSIDDAINDQRGEVIAALAKLSPEQREVVLLRFYHELKLEEIADVTGAPLGTVKSRLFHALKGLKGFLAVTDIAYERT